MVGSGGEFELSSGDGGGGGVRVRVRVRVCVYELLSFLKYMLMLWRTL